MAKLLEACGRAAGTQPRVTWASESFLEESGVGAWIELPLWLPSTPENAGFMEVDCGRARAAGLTFRPVEATVRDTLAWDRSRPAGIERKAGLTPEREAELLRSWHARPAA